jgi:CO/xanthine dehydrogenase FAD-binding subunit
MRFNYLEPSSIDEAITLLLKYGDEAKVFAGNTDIIVQLRKKAIKPNYLINLGFITALDYIKYDNNGTLKIGALATVRAVEKLAEIKQKHPVIAEAASHLASVQVRNVATVAGNLCNASPSADMAPALIGCSAKANIIGPDGERSVLLEDFFTGPGTTVLKKGEILKQIEVPPLMKGTGGTYIKHAIRGGVDLAIVGVAVVLNLESSGGVCKDVKIVLGAVAPTPIRAKRAEEVLKGKKITQAEIDEASRLASGCCQPISDVRASAEYRCEMVHVITRYAIKAAINAVKQ